MRKVIETIHSCSVILDQRRKMGSLKEVAISALGAQRHKFAKVVLVYKISMTRDIDQ